jgi:hypothetical protein
VDVITFNHDLVIENEIYKRARLRNRWCLDEGYGSFSNGKALLGSSSAMFPSHGPDCDHTHPINVHKMHGSLNWLVRIRGREPAHSVLTGSGGPADVMVSRQRSIPGALRVRMGGTKGRQMWYTWPVIVPPIYGKHSLIRAFMPSVWDDARVALESSDRVLFCGYSMPPADIEAEKLLQRSVAKNPSLPWVGIIDPGTATVARFVDAMPGVALRRFPSVKSFFDAADSGTAW